VAERIVTGTWRECWEVVTGSQETSIVLHWHLDSHDEDVPSGDIQANPSKLQADFIHRAQEPMLSCTEALDTALVFKYL
jgi:hypothetical protein